MSLYNMLFGVNKAAPVLLAALGLTVDEIPRFRDCYVEGETIVIHTRTGGGNREDYQEQNDALAANPYYEYDADDDFDSTYANFVFRFPEEYTEELKALSANMETVTPSEKWKLLLAALEAPPSSDSSNAAS